VTQFDNIVRVISTIEFYIRATKLAFVSSLVFTLVFFDTQMQHFDIADRAIWVRKTSRFSRKEQKKKLKNPFVYSRTGLIARYDYLKTVFLCKLAIVNVFLFFSEMIS